jgi:hypothetical protein
MIRNKKGFEFSFGWLFAIIVGAIIIFLAIFAATRFVQTSRVQQDTFLGKELGIILNPLETSLESGKLTPIALPLETKIFNDCNTRGTFGTQRISAATKSGIGSPWESPGTPSSFKNKYLFTEKIIEGKNYFAFSKPLKMPFKIADLIFLLPDKQIYCFINPPNDLESELTNLQIPNVEITSSLEDCPTSSNKICFELSNRKCDAEISISGKTVRKGLTTKTLYYESNTLLFAAIFSDPEIYECHLKRLMNRASELSWLYFSKSSFLTPKGCSSNLEADLALYADQSFSFESSQDIIPIFQNSENLRRRNNELSCKLF